MRFFYRNYLTEKLHFRTLDVMTLVFVSFQLIYIIAGWNRVVKPLPIFSGYLAIFTGLFFIVRIKDDCSSILRTIITFFRKSYPFFLLGFFFNSSTSVDLILIREPLDPLFKFIDQLIFNYQPSIVWGTVLSSWIWQEIFHFSYFSYYVMIAFMAIFMFFKKRNSYDRYVFIVSFVFYVCYITYSLLPVIGARYMQEALELSQTYRAGPFTHLMVLIYRNVSHFGGAFPSSHVALALVITIFIWQQIPRIRYIQSVLFLLLAVSTVFCHYHYFIDTVFGIVYGFFFYAAGEKIYRKSELIALKQADSAGDLCDLKAVN